MGDVVGKPGLLAIRTLLPKLIGRHAVDLVIANAENSEGGAGISAESAEALLKAEVNVLTSGNHIWSKRQIIPWLERNPDLLLRPANYPKGAPGKGHTIARTPDGRKLGVVNLEGRVFMKPLDDPFTVGLAAVEELRKETRCILVDMHCEASSEKNAMGAFLDGKVSAVVGTHTHVQTADERILPGGTAFITDVGMVGPLDSVIGIRKELSIERFLSQRPTGYEVAKNLVYLQGVVVDIDEETGKARSIERVPRAAPRHVVPRRRRLHVRVDQHLGGRRPHPEDARAAHQVQRHRAGLQFVPVLHRGPRAADGLAVHQGPVGGGEVLDEPGPEAVLDPELAAGHRRVVDPDGRVRAATGDVADVAVQHRQHPAGGEIDHPEHVHPGPGLAPEDGRRAERLLHRGVADGLLDTAGQLAVGGVAGLPLGAAQRRGEHRPEGVAPHHRRQRVALEQLQHLGDAQQALVVVGDLQQGGADRRLVAGPRGGRQQQHHPAHVAGRARHHRQRGLLGERRVAVPEQRQRALEQRGGVLRPPAGTRLHADLHPGPSVWEKRARP